MDQPLRGVFTAVLTPYTDDLSLDSGLLARHCARLLREGCHGVSLFGTTGEGPALTCAERVGGLEAVIAAGIAPSAILPGTGAASLMETVALSRHAVAAGCRHLLVMPPYFFKDVPDDGVFAYFAEVIERTGAPEARFYLYNFPGVTSVWIRRDVVARLRARFGAAVAGVKDSSGDWDYVTGLIADHPGMSVFSGWEILLPKLLRAGGAGNISGLANLIAGPLRRVFDSHQTADQTAAFKAIESLVETVCRNPVTPAIKAANAALRGEGGWRNIRPPLRALDGAAEPDVLAAFRKLI